MSDFDSYWDDLFDSSDSAKGNNEGPAAGNGTANMGNTFPNAGQVTFQGTSANGYGQNAYPSQGYPVNNVPVQNIPAQGYPVNNVPVQNIPAQGYPVNNAPVQNIPAQGYPVNNVPVQNTPVNNYSVQNYGENSSNNGGNFAPGAYPGMPAANNINNTAPTGKKKIDGKAIALISILSVLGIAACVLGYFSVKSIINRFTFDYSFSSNSGNSDSSDIDIDPADYGFDTDTDTDTDDDSDPAQTMPSEEDVEAMLSGTQAESEEYYSFGNAIAEDLDYQISIEVYYEKSDDGDLMIYAGYPVLEGDIPNADIIAGEIREEADSWIDFYEQCASGTGSDSELYLQIYLTPFVTYMTEDVLSIVYSENISMFDFNNTTVTYSFAKLVCVNIDINSGFKLQNNKILAADTDFAEELLKKSEVQNGSNSAISNYSADSLLQLLEDNDSLIIFYTPLGLEVGANTGTGWTTVTFIDYEQYLNSN